MIVSGPARPRSPARERKFQPRPAYFSASTDYPDGVAAPLAVLVPPSGLDDREQAELLRAALARFAWHADPFPDHPYLGRLTREEWIRFHCLHAAHHLSFAVPTADDTSC